MNRQPKGPVRLSSHIGHFASVRATISHLVTTKEKIVSCVFFTSYNPKGFMIFFFFFWNTGFKCFQMGDLSSSLLELVRIISGVLNAPDKGTVSAVKICIHISTLLKTP